MNYRLILSYDGTGYYGWQKTSTGPSIQEELEKALFRITGEAATPEAASRTDRGVHAEGQSVQLALEKPRDPALLLRGLNAVLPPSIRVLDAQAASPDFHATLDASGKIYHYRLCLGPVQDPLHRLYSWHFRYPLDLSLMEQAAQMLLGTHDFTAFANEPEENPLCTLNSIAFEKLPYNRLQISVQGDRFLYKMVRNLAGTLIYIGAQKLAPDAIPRILASRDRKTAGVTAPAHGLFLSQVFYK